MSAFLTELRQTVRRLARSPGFVIPAVVCIALGIGVNTTVFSTVNAMLIRPLPFHEPERLVEVHETLPLQGMSRNSLSLPNYADLAAETRAFEGLAAFRWRNFNLSAAGEPEHRSGAAVTAGFFPVLGVAPALGRTFRPEEDRPGAGRVVVIGHRLWELHLGADPSVIGRTIRVDGEPATVIGVMPPSFAFPEFADLWAPLALDPARERRDEHYLQAFARLKPGVTRAEARADVETVARRLADRYPETNAGASASVIPLRDRLVPSAVRRAVVLMLGATGLVLLVACANVGNLLLARAAGRTRELAVRRALGAGRLRILRELLLESLLLALVGGALGTFLAVWGLDLVRAAIPVEIPRWIRFDIEPRVLAFTLLASGLAALLFGLAPSLKASQPDLQESLKEGGRGAGEGLGRNRLRSALVVAEVGIALVLLVSALLLIQTFMHIQRIDPGFDPRNVLTLQLSLAGPRYEGEPEREAFLRDVVREIEGIPGVQAAGAIAYLPLGDSWSSVSFEVDGRPVKRGEEPLATHHPVTAHTLAALGVLVLQGRAFTDREAADSTAAVVVVNEILARRFWPEGEAIGGRIRFAPDEPWLTVIGVAETVHRGLQIWDVSKPELEVYVPHASSPRRTMALVVRTAAGPASFAPAVKARIRAVDSELPVYDVLTMEEWLSRVFWMPRFLGQMFGVFAALALVLAAVGVYGVMAYSVARRRHELGIRMALGADSRDVVRLVIRQGLTLAGLGLGLGLAAALPTTRLLGSLLYEVGATDLATFAGVTLALGVVAILASWLPARRATRVDPMAALRYE